MLNGHESYWPCSYQAMLQCTSKAKIKKCGCAKTGSPPGLGSLEYIYLWVPITINSLESISSVHSGCNVNHKGFGVHRTPLHYAIQNGHTELALLLLERGADPNDCRALPISGSHDFGSIRVFRGHARRVQVTVPSPFCYAIELGIDRLVEYMLSQVGFMSITDILA
jgi:hypothetical protein